MVVMSLDHYERQLAQLELYQKLEEARKAIAAGEKGKDAKRAIKAMMKS